jgi:hypothetical protein
VLLAALRSLGPAEQEAAAELVAGGAPKLSLYLTSQPVAEERVTVERRVCLMGSRAGLWRAVEGRAGAGGWPSLVGGRLGQGGLWRQLLDRIGDHVGCGGTVGQLVGEVAAISGSRSTDLLACVS